MNKFESCLNRVNLAIDNREENGVFVKLPLMRCATIQEALEIASFLQPKTIKDIFLDGRTYLVLDEDGEIFPQFFEYPNDLEHYEDCTFYDISILPKPPKEGA